jgi:hypothetical protein
MESITSYAFEPPTTVSNAFYNVKRSIPVYVPQNAINDYKQASVWDEFYNYEAIPEGEIDPPTGIDEINTNPVRDTKILRNGQLLIRRDGKIYTITGQEVK